MRRLIAIFIALMLVVAIPVAASAEAPEPLRIAVTPASSDNIGSVLEEMANTPWETVFNFSAVDIPYFDVLFINCGTSVPGNVLRSFVEQGGIVYISDLARASMDDAFPEREFEWASLNSQWTTGYILNEDLAISLGSSEIEIHYDLGGWRLLTSPIQDDMRVYIEGPVTGGWNVEEGVNYPFTWSFPHGDQGGRVIFTSFHTSAQDTDDMQALLFTLVSLITLGDLPELTEDIFAEYGFGNPSLVFGNLPGGATSASFNIDVTEGEDFAVINNPAAGDFSITLTSPDGFEYSNIDNTGWVYGEIAGTPTASVSSFDGISQVLGASATSYGALPNTVVGLGDSQGIVVMNPTTGVDPWTFTVTSQSEAGGSFVVGVSTDSDGTFTPSGLPVFGPTEYGTVFNGVDFGLVYHFEFYMAVNPDLAEVFGDNPDGAILHFVNTGMDEGRLAHPNFNVHRYSNANLDLRTVFRDDLRSFFMHYITNGHAEDRSFSAFRVGFVTELDGIDYSLVYNMNTYLGRYTDVLEAFGFDEFAVLEHFVNSGMAEGRVAAGWFNVNYYRNANPDLRMVFGYDLRAYFMHFINQGHFEDRTFSTIMLDPLDVMSSTDFSLVYYMNEYLYFNPDIAETFGSDEIAILHHFVNSGMQEGRQAISTFNVHVYRYNNADLYEAFGDDVAAYFMHYIIQGHAEGRIAY